MRMRVCAILMGASLFGLASLPVLAGLGENVSSVASDRVHMKAQQRSVTSGAGFTIHEMQMPSGTLVREYVAPGGTVFAVSWHGPSKPDLRELFGTYFDRYVKAARAAPHGSAARRHFEVREPDLIVQSSGRMRAYFGRAYVPSLVPSGVALNDIQ